ncbi:hypothetical protein [Nitrospira calida]|jgi:hypothetical protein
MPSFVARDESIQAAVITAEFKQDLARAPRTSHGAVVESGGATVLYDDFAGLHCAEKHWMQSVIRTTQKR